MATRNKGRRVRKITPEERAQKEARNLRRGRSEKAIKARQWEREHVVKRHPLAGHGRPAKNKRQQATDAVADALKSLPAVEDART